jgi:hypothetical protein
MRHSIAKLVAGTLVAGSALALAACGSDSAGNNAAANNFTANELGNVGDPAAVEMIGNAGNEAMPAAPANGVAPPPTDVPMDSPGDVGGDMGGNTGAAINGM